MRGYLKDCLSTRSSGVPDMCKIEDAIEDATNATGGSKCRAR